MSERLPDRVRRILPASTAETWVALAPHLPTELYLGGGTAVAVHLGHRESRDLDFFFHQKVDIGEVKNLIDVEVDKLLSIDKPKLQAWWSVRQVEVLRNSDRFN